MELEKKILRGAVIEGYTVLMRAEAELLLPVGKRQMEAFYLSLSEKCMTWAVEVRGEQLRAEFLSLETPEKKAKFKTRQYRFFMQTPWENPPHVAILCESTLKGEEEALHAYRRVSHVWNTEEETMLPMDQIVGLFDKKSNLKKLRFRPDGVYPEEDTLVFYKNSRKDNDFMEVRRKFGKIGRKC